MIHYIGETLVMEFGHGTLLAVSGVASSDEGKATGWESPGRGKGAGDDDD